jgi:hypothetical protein
MLPGLLSTQVCGCTEAQPTARFTWGRWLVPEADFSKRHAFADMAPSFLLADSSASDAVAGKGQACHVLANVPCVCFCNLPASDRMQAAEVSEHMGEEWRADRRMGLISLGMWGGTAIRVFPLLSLWQNLQSASAMVVSKCTSAP